MVNLIAKVRWYKKAGFYSQESLVVDSIVPPGLGLTSWARAWIFVDYETYYSYVAILGTVTLYVCRYGAYANRLDSLDPMGYEAIHSMAKLFHKGVVGHPPPKHMVSEAVQSIAKSMAGQLGLNDEGFVKVPLDSFY